MNKKTRVLIVSHNPFSINFNMGRTLSSFFKGWNKESLAQFYFRPEMPSGNICDNYYKFSDTDALKSILVRNRKGTIIKQNDGEHATAIIELDKYNKAYKLGPQKKPIVSFFRDLVWDLSSWRNRHFKKWLVEFSPDIVFFASGDYSFSYKIVLRIAKDFGIPIVTFCADDYYLFTTNNNKFLGKAYHRNLLKWARKIINYSSAIVTLNDLMATDYSRYFSKTCKVIYTGTNYSCRTTKALNNKICYLGNLGLGRAETLVHFANQFRLFSRKNDLDIEIDVYSNEQRENILKMLKSCDNISFHGPISYKEVEIVTKSSLAVLHVESFEENNKNRVKYSFSTKIADILASGTPLIAYGPSDIASITYLKKNKCAIVISNDEEFDTMMSKLFDNSLTEGIVNHAKQVADVNHNCNKNSELLASIIDEAIVSFKPKENK